MVKYPPDTIIKVSIPPAESTFWNGKKRLVLALTFSRGWIVLEKSGWVEIEGKGLRIVRNIISEALNHRLEDILDIKRGNEGR